MTVIDKLTKYASSYDITDPIEILNVISQMQKHINEIHVNNRNIINTEIEIIKANIKTITPSKQMRKRRGLINGGGTIHKWLFGRMDDDDRRKKL